MKSSITLNGIKLDPLEDFGDDLGSMIAGSMAVLGSASYGSKEVLLDTLYLQADEIIAAVLADASAEAKPPESGPKFDLTALQRWAFLLQLARLAVDHPLPEGALADMIAPRALYAWVGEDELGSGHLGLKRALVPAGDVPLVGIDQEKMAQQMIRRQLQMQADRYGKTIRLCRYLFDHVVAELFPR